MLPIVTAHHDSGELHPGPESLGLRAKRYSDQAFPAYHYVPGRNPHPTADPRGHSYTGGGHGEPASPWRAEDWRELDEYLYGCDIYNHAYWWEAHEAWEALWRAAPLDSIERHFLQGVIQVSASQLKLLVGDVRGVERLMASSGGHLKHVPDEFMGLAVREFYEQAREYLLAGLASTPPIHNAKAYPYIVLANPAS
jgi:hypothetical protein